MQTINGNYSLTVKDDKDYLSVSDKSYHIFKANNFLSVIGYYLLKWFNASYCEVELKNLNNVHVLVHTKDLAEIEKLSKAIFSNEDDEEIEYFKKIPVKFEMQPVMNLPMAVIDTHELDYEMHTRIENALRENGLEILMAENENEYCHDYKVERGLVIYIMQYEANDKRYINEDTGEQLIEHGQFDAGTTIKTAYEKAIAVLKQFKIKGEVDQDAIQVLTKAIQQMKDIAAEMGVEMKNEKYKNRPDLLQDDYTIFPIEYKDLEDLEAMLKHQND